MFKMLPLVAIMSVSLAHEGHHHETQTAQIKKDEATPKNQAAYQEIQALYLKDVKPIFDMKCAACHSSTVVAPSYASWPIVGQIVESDRTEAKEHLEISKGFPFAGHGTPEEDLLAIKKDIIEGNMPTFLYKLFHSSSRITDQEKSIILQWVEESQNLILNRDSSTEHPAGMPTN